MSILRKVKNVIKGLILQIFPNAKFDFIRQIRHKIKFLVYGKKYKYPLIYIACCPKVASTWISHLLLELLPGYELYYPRDYADGPYGNNFDLTDKVVNELRNKLLIVRAHTPPTPHNIESLNKSFGRYVTLTRDARDVIVSAYYQIHKDTSSAFVDAGRERNLPWKPIAKKDLSLSKHDFMDVLIDQVMPALVSMLKGWAEYAEGHNNVVNIRYEDLTSDTFKEIKRVLSLLEINHISDEKIRSVIEKMSSITKISKEKKKAYNIRQGKRGSWSDELTPQQQERCNRIAEPYLEAVK